MSASFPALDTILAGLLDRYRTHVPDVDRVIHAMVADGLVRDAADIEFAERRVLDVFADLPGGIPRIRVAATRQEDS